WPDLTGASDQGLTLWRNVGGTFNDVTHDLIQMPVEWRSQVDNAVWGDVDGDGDLDIYCALSAGHDALLINEDLRFFEATDRGIPEAGDVRGVSLADVDGDQDLDIYITRGRLREYEAGNLEPQPGAEGAPNILLLNDGTGHFVDATDAWGAAAGGASESFGGLLADYDRDGDPDLMITRDFETDHFLTNTGGTFEDTSAAALPADATSLMGMAAGDYNGDGHLDVYATDVGSDALYLGRGDGTFEVAFATWIGDGDPTATLTGWGIAAIDADNDGDQDVIGVSAWEYADQHEDLSRIGAYTLLENQDATFTDVAEPSGLGEVIHGTALAVADYDLDGDLDVAVALAPPQPADFGPDPLTVRAGIRLLRNESARAAGKRFMEVSLRELGSKNAWAIGAIVDVITPAHRAARVVTSGDSYVSSHSFVQHFGLGDSAEADVHVRWPGGERTIAHNVPGGYVRMSPHDGDCCWPGADCGDPWIDCPVWSPANDPCKGEIGCDVCQLVCDKLTGCGAGDGCAAECAIGPPEASEAVCVLDAACDVVEACFLSIDEQDRFDPRDGEEGPDGGEDGGGR
ncbi:MAG: hypothetical protein ACI9WU_002783, partial [Myxococcota bacterium]